VIALIWFYLLSLAMLAGAVINALRFELHATETLREWPEHGEPGTGPGPPCAER
jgi:hypothetical protein